MMELKEFLCPQKSRAKRSLKVLFVYTYLNGFHYDNYHFGVASLISVTRDNHHDPDVMVLTAKKHFEDFETKLKEFKPDVIGFSSVSSQFMFIKELAGIAKKCFPGVITVCGGVHPTLDQNCILECDDLDGLIRGEAEVALVEFLEKGDKCFNEGKVNIDAFQECSKERRESVLNFSEEYHNMIMHFYSNWGTYIFPIWTSTGFHFRPRKLVVLLGLLDTARKMNRNIKKSCA